MPSPADPVAVRFLGFEIRWYAIFILVGIVAGVSLVRALARRRGMDPNFPVDVVPWVILAGIIGARLYYFALRWDYFLANPDQALTLRLGGLTIHGALAGGIVMLFYLCRRAGYSFLAWADLIVPGVALGQAIGRWGNWANQEAFGRPSDLPWAVAIDAANRPPALAEATRFHPTFLYESLANLAIAAMLAWLALRVGRPGGLRPGDVLWIYFILYGVTRLAIEGQRTDSLFIGPLPAAYWLSLGLIALGGVMLFLRHTGRVPRQSADADPA